MGYFRVGYYEQWDLTDNGLPGEELGGSLRSIYYKGIRRKGFGKEQRVYWAQVGWALLISPLTILQNIAKILIQTFSVVDNT